MTKIVILGEEPQKKELKKIEFVKHYNSVVGEFVNTEGKPSEWMNVYKLNMKIDGMDVFFCQYNNVVCSSSGNLFLGYFNDGVV